MNKKKIIIFITIILIIVGGVWLYYYLQNNRNGTVGNGLNSLFPFSGTNENIGKGGKGGEQATTTNSQNGTSETVNPIYNPLIELSKKPVTGITLLPTYVGTSTTQTDLSIIPTVRFMEKGTGFLYDVSARAEKETQKTNTSIAKVTETYFGDAGKTVILRYLKEDNTTIATYLGKVFPPIVNQEGIYGSIKGEFLSDNIMQFVMNPSGTSFDYLVQTDTGSEAIRLNTDKSNKQSLFISSFSEWLLDLTQGGLMATTKPSSDVLGYAYLIQPSGAFQRVLGKINGLTTKLSPDGNAVLYSESFGNSVGLFIKNFSDSKAIKTGLSTFPDKCVWNNNSRAIYCAVPAYMPNDTYPDSWYQGIEHFSDTLYKISADSGATTYLADLGTNKIDAINLVLEDNERFLVFQNKNDSTAWSYDLKPQK